MGGYLDGADPNFGYFGKRIEPTADPQRHCELSGDLGNRSTRVRDSGRAPTIS